MLKKHIDKLDLLILAKEGIQSTGPQVMIIQIHLVQTILTIGLLELTPHIEVAQGVHVHQELFKQEVLARKAEVQEVAREVQEVAREVQEVAGI